MSKAQEVISNLHWLRIKDKKVFEVELDQVTHNAQQCWKYLYDVLLDKHNQKLTAPTIEVISREKPMRTHFSWKKDNYFLFLEIKNQAEVYAEYGESESIFSRRKTYLRLDDFTIDEIEDVLLLFTEEAQ